MNNKNKLLNVENIPIPGECMNQKELRHFFEKVMIG